MQQETRKNSKQHLKGFIGSINWGYEAARRAAVDNGAVLYYRLKHVLMDAISRVDVFEVESKMRTIQKTDFPPMTQSMLSFFDDFQILNGIPVFVLRPAEHLEIDGEMMKISMRRKPRESLRKFESSSSHITDPCALTASAFSKDATLFVSGHENGSILVWNAEHGTLKRSLTGPNRSPISDLAFYKDSSQILAVCDFSGVLSIWDVSDERKDPVVVNCNSNWERTRMPSVEGQCPKLSPDGSLLVCPVQIVFERTKKEAGKPSKIIFPLTEYIQLNTTRSQVERQENLFQHYCILHVFDTRSSNITQDNPFGEIDGRSYCWGKTIEMQPISKLFIPMLADSRDYALSSTEVSYNGKGLLIGVSSRPTGHLILWPDFRNNAHQSYRLEGMVGRWSLCDEWIVSWDAPLKNILRSEDGTCRVYYLKTVLQSSERCRQNGSEDHPRFWTESFARFHCPSGNSIHWADFVWITSDSCQQSRQIGAATCSVGDNVQVVLWDIKLQIPVQCFYPNIKSSDVILNTPQAWMNKWMLVKPSWGLNFMTTSGDKKLLGFFSVSANRGIIYDTEQRVERLWMSLSDKDGHVDASNLNHMDLIMSTEGNKFVTMNENTMMIWLPKVLEKQEKRGASWLALESSDDELENGKLKCQFSGDGSCIGLMRLYCSVMNIWNLRTGQRIVLQQSKSKSPRAFQNDEDWESQDSDIHMELLSPSRHAKPNQKKRFCQFCISKCGDLVATCMGDMSVLLWDLTKGEPEYRYLATLESRYCVAWAVTFTEGPDGQPVHVVACEDTGHLVWVSIYPHPRIMDRQFADGKKRCAFSANGSRAVLMPDDIQVRVWDVVERTPLFSCTYNIWLGESGLIPFPHNVSLDGKMALIGLDATNSAVVANPETTYSDFRGLPEAHRPSLIPSHITVNEDISWFVADGFRAFDFETLRKSKTKCNRTFSDRHVLSSSTSVSRATTKAIRDSRVPRVQFDKVPEEEERTETEETPSEAASSSTTQNQPYPNIRTRLSNEQLWDYLRVHPAAESTTDIDEVCEKLIVMSISGEESTKEIAFPDLASERFIAISSDGTKIACMDKRHRLNVWSAHASDGCIPTSQMLLNRTDVPLDDLEKQLDAFGPGIINSPDHNGLTLLLSAVVRKDVALLKRLLVWAKNKGLKISLRDELIDGKKETQVLNALNMALGFRSPETTRVIMKYLLEGVCTEVETAMILHDSLVKLSAVYPSILQRILENKRIMLRLYELTVPEWAFARSECKVMACNQLIPTPQRLESMWVNEELTKQEGFFRKSVLKRTSAYACVMPYPDIAKLGMDGILRPLLLNKAPHHIFATWPIRCVIKFKWGLYGKRLIIEDCVHYVALLISFTLYALLIGFLVKDTQDDEKDTSKNNADSILMAYTVFTLVACIFLAIGPFCRKLQQLLVMWRSGRWSGVFYWLLDSFNVTEIATYVFIIGLVPAAYAVDITSRTLASAVAITCIMLWAKTLYYAQAFKGTGPLVIMIREIIQDIRFYIFLMFAILMGFAIAFFVLFRNEQVNQKECLDISSEEAETDECIRKREVNGQIEELFGSFDRVLITMFTMLLGEVGSVSALLFNVRPGLKFVGFIMFIMYLLAVTIVLLNLLIAIMGDGFDRVKATDMSFFLKKRAQIIDDMEAAMTGSRVAELSEKIETYLHILMPKHKSETYQPTGEWQGRTKDAQHRLKRDLVKYLQQYSQTLDAIKEKQAILERKIDELVPSSLTPSRVLSESRSHILPHAVSRSHGGARPVEMAEPSEDSDVDDDIFGDDSDMDST